mgnify:CR=1 FL=1
MGSPSTSSSAEGQGWVIFQKPSPLTMSREVSAGTRNGWLVSEYSEVTCSTFSPLVE